MKKDFDFTWVIFFFILVGFGLVLEFLRASLEDLCIFGGRDSEEMNMYTI